MAGSKWLLIAGLAIGLVAAYLAVKQWLRPPAGDTGIVSLVLFLREPSPLKIEQVQAAAEQAFGRKFVLHDGAATHSVLRAGQPGLFVVKTPEQKLGVISVAETYMPDVAAAADRQRVFLLKRAIQDHQAWLSVDWIEGAPVDSKYDAIGKLIAELASDNCLALYCPEKGQMNSYAADLLPLLRGPDPLAALRQPRADPIVQVKDDDAEMAAAVKEARARWPEFVAAFAKKKPMQGFAVKAPFKDDQGVEFMWVEVARIDQDQIHGKLVSQPATVRHVKLNDEVSVKLADLNDWIYSDGAAMVGGFTGKVLESRGKK